MISCITNWFSRRKGSIGIKRTEVRIVCCAALEDYWNNEQQKTINERFYVIRFTDRQDNKGIDIRLNKVDAERVCNELRSLLEKEVAPKEKANEEDLCMHQIRIFSCPMCSNSHSTISKYLEKQQS